MNPKRFGRISALWRYPVKSMAGEAVTSVAVTPRGILGDRAYALVDDTTGMVASAKNPRAWPDLFMYRAAFTAPPQADRDLAAVEIIFPDGRVLTERWDDELSAALGRRVTLSSRPPDRPTLQQFWPAKEGVGEDGHVTAEAMPMGTFFDLAVVNVLLTTTLGRLSAEYPQGRFDISRFRPNIVITPEPGVTRDPEAASVGGTLTLGDAVRLHIDSRCGRCVMTTLAQSDLPKDPGILRTVARVNDGFVGLNTAVTQTGVIRVGDAVWIGDVPATLT